jgi:dihydropteroate synthase
VGTSRKSFLGAYAADRDGRPAGPDDRLEPTIATVACAVVAGAALVRVHDVAPAAALLALAGPGGAAVAA